MLMMSNSFMYSLHCLTLKLTREYSIVGNVQVKTSENKAARFFLTFFIPFERANSRAKDLCVHVYHCTYVLCGRHVL